MYPKHHAAVSGMATVLYAAWMQAEPVQMALWAVIGITAGVMIDVDHVLLGMLVDGRVAEGLSWFRQPVTAVTRPDALLADMEYDTMVYHRLLSHTVVLTVLVALIRFHSLFIPAAVGLAAHIAADVVWDVKQRSYWFLS